MGSESEHATSAHPTGESDTPKEIQPKKNFIGERGEQGEQGEQREQGEQGEHQPGSLTKPTP